MEEQSDIHSFLYPNRLCTNELTSELLIFKGNLQEFAMRVNYICNLETIGKLSTEDSYEQINLLWEQLERSYLALGLNSSTED
ncbi:MAG: hypothetical protein KME55_36745 [Nostoc indistinguendum CM1-VF10]|jgi:hypothetical protein|nr:hypothetical protein [Nostoc indistinguendum CM1-VF10]